MQLGSMFYVYFEQRKDTTLKDLFTPSYLKMYCIIHIQQLYKLSISA